jgi:hypothetical protein
MMSCVSRAMRGHIVPQNWQSTFDIIPLQCKSALSQRYIYRLHLGAFHEYSSLNKIMIHESYHVARILRTEARMLCDQEIRRL